ncbi:hypothetical protein [Viridibacterium curvum]|uniref:TIGR02449 family protein n=1 Tax=Viridibacterium curvum TaxID=1101404 RepID=A0ABP9QIJ3_9RHOO
MDSELKQLEENAHRLLAEYQQLRDEHRTLVERSTALEADNRRLRDKLNQAIARVEALIARLPEQEES